MKQKFITNALEGGEKLMATKTSNKHATVSRFSVLKGSKRQPQPIRKVTMRCAGECTCRCCKN